MFKQRGLNKMPLLTVAVSTFRKSYLNRVTRLLRSLQNQTFKDFTVLLVVNTDATYYETLLKTIPALNLSFSVNVLFNPIDLGIAHSRNLSLNKASTPYIAYTDDDIIPGKRWLEKIYKTLKISDNIGAATGPVLANWSPDSQNIRSWFPKELYWIIGCTPWAISDTQEVRNGFASNLGLKREIALLCGGFNEAFGYNPRNSLVGEEPEFGIKLRRLGKYTMWNPEAIVYHDVTKNRLLVKGILKRSFAEGVTKAYLRQIMDKETSAPEVNHMQAVIKAIIKDRSIKSKILLSSSTFAVIIGFLYAYGKRIDSLTTE
jgi:glucosyl-dolichyl phosphate glucuronosyltransferase